uniref:Uncharacterized protein n=1 Tax=Chromera velia CCMP2878 TaxID=1169474 RepID=A0A0G4I9H2_9ALVE|eukprot:Cvel_12143.t1-p1 / transcript=Cvel_12143.t1 / gene=Cvel_12143 / organism=Chromera_velia_CCMP2878 / gene_product=hypothetical protein / transcript_product=hypothetical protein / location=Cvel_scaffold782:64024-65049(+) / protein_length=342 / sequence_SO=supercontig / SO=protein_coding / is_pseudo=false
MLSVSISMEEVLRDKDSPRLCKTTLIPEYALKKGEESQCAKVVLEKGCDGKAPGSECDTSVTVGAAETCISVEENPEICFCRNLENLAEQNKERAVQQHSLPLSGLAHSCQLDKSLTCESTLVPHTVTRLDGDKSCHVVSVIESCDGKNPADSCDTSVTAGAEEKCFGSLESPGVCFCRHPKNVPPHTEKTAFGSVSELGKSNCEISSSEENVCMTTLAPAMAKSIDTGFCVNVMIKEDCAGQKPGDSCNTSVSEGAEERCYASSESPSTCFCRNPKNLKDVDDSAPMTVLAKSSCEVGAQTSGTPENNQKKESRAAALFPLSPLTSLSLPLFSILLPFAFQ